MRPASCTADEFAELTPRIVILSHNPARADRSLKTRVGDISGRRRWLRKTKQKNDASARTLHSLNLPSLTTLEKRQSGLEQRSPGCLSGLTGEPTAGAVHRGRIPPS